MSDLTRLNPTPHAIAVYASQPLSPVATQHSLPSRTRPFNLGRTFTGWIAPALPGARSGRDVRFIARPPHRIVRAAFPHPAPTAGGCRPCAVRVPAPVTRLSGSAPGTCFAGPHSPWSPPFAPPAPLRPSLQTPPQWISSLCSPASQLLWRGPTSRVRASSATAPHLPDADRRTRHTARDDGGQTRDLPGSDTILLHVMWP